MPIVRFHLRDVDHRLVHLEHLCEVAAVSIYVFQIIIILILLFSLWVILGFLNHLLKRRILIYRIWNKILFVILYQMIFSSIHHVYVSI